MTEIELIQEDKIDSAMAAAALPKTFIEALCKAQGEFKPVKKSETAGGGSYSYNYAPLAEILEAVKPALAKHGFILTFAPGAPEVNGEGPKAPCRVPVRAALYHAAGGVLEAGVTMLAATSESKNIGGAITYGSRYLVAAMLAIPLHGEDYDIAGLGEKPIGSPPPAPAKPEKRRPGRPRKRSADSETKPAPEPAKPAEKAEAPSSVEEDPKVVEWQTRAWELVLRLAEGEEDAALEILGDATEFVGRDGKKVRITDISKLRERWQFEKLAQRLKEKFPGAFTRKK